MEYLNFYALNSADIFQNKAFRHISSLSFLQLFYFQISNCRHSPSHFLFYLVTLTRCWQSFVQVFSLFPSESVPVIFKRTTVKLLRRTESFKTKCDTHNRTAFYLSSSARPGSLAAEKSLVIKRCLKSGRSQAAVTAGWLKSEVR